jgi:hypothetical protein
MLTSERRRVAAAEEPAGLRPVDGADCGDGVPVAPDVLRLEPHVRYAAHTGFIDIRDSGQMITLRVNPTHRILLTTIDDETVYTSST